MSNQFSGHHPLLTVAIGGLLVGALAGTAPAQPNCAATSVGLTPIDDLGTGLYLAQFQGGLYPNGSNLMPPPHLQIASNAAGSVFPRNQAGQLDPNGRTVLLSIGMSNTSQEFCGGALACSQWSFAGQAAVSPEVNHRDLLIINGAAGGQAATTWTSPTDANYNRVRDQVLAPQGLSEAQVQAVWIKQANFGNLATASLPAANADAYNLEASLGDIVRAVRIRYPNARLVFLSSRIYAGYHSASSPHREPIAYEGAFSVKWLIEAQIRQRATGVIDPVAGDLGPAAAPWIGWGPYLWADGLTPRSDGLIWQCSDFENDGIHPAMPGEAKVGSMLLDFFLESPASRRWFRADRGCAADLTTSAVPNSPGYAIPNGRVNNEDFFYYLQQFSIGNTAVCDLTTHAVPGQPGYGVPNGLLNNEDFFYYLALFSAPC